MAVALSNRTERQLVTMFPDAQERERARKLLEHECGDHLPGWSDRTAAGLERIRFAVLKLSGGSSTRLAQNVSLAKVDWRDALVAAGFADDAEAHLTWDPE